jgi:short-subunit dehydrogenase
MEPSPGSRVVITGASRGIGRTVAEVREITAGPHQ